MGTPLCVFLVVNTLKEHRWFFNMQLLIGHGQVPTIMPEASENPAISANEIAEILNVKAEAVRYRIKLMKKSGEITRKGATKAGEWEVIE